MSGRVNSHLCAVNLLGSAAAEFPVKERVLEFGRAGAGACRRSHKMSRRSLGPFFFGGGGRGGRGMNLALLSLPDGTFKLASATNSAFNAQRNIVFRILHKFRNLRKENLLRL